MRAPVVLLLATIAQAGGDDPLDKLRERYGIRVLVQEKKYERNTLHGKLAYGEADKKSVQRYARILAEEFARYPKEFVRRSGLRALVLCGGLMFNGQKRAALPDRGRWVVIYDVTAAPRQPAYARHVIHHEYFHLIDWVGSSWKWRIPQWKKLNAQGFKYGKGGRTMQHDNTAWSLATGTKGFLNRYSQSSVSEDMAEVFAFLMTRPKEVARRAEQDEILKAKVRVMKSHLHLFNETMDSAFWKRGRAVETKAKAPFKER
ncbi:MAG: putative zinc-binding metallopeptidase [Planctomycetota bacterium]